MYPSCFHRTANGVCSSPVDCVALRCSFRIYIINDMWKCLTKICSVITKKKSHQSRDCFNQQRLDSTLGFTNLGTDRVLIKPDGSLSYSTDDVGMLDNHLQDFVVGPEYNQRSPSSISNDVSNSSCACLLGKSKGNIGSNQLVVHTRLH